MTKIVRIIHFSTKLLNDEFTFYLINMMDEKINVF